MIFIPYIANAIADGEYERHVAGGERVGLPRYSFLALQFDIQQCGVEYPPINQGHGLVDRGSNSHRFASCLGQDKSPLSAARREFAEETWASPNGEFMPLGDPRQPAGKILHLWAVQDDWDMAELRSNTFEMEWPPRSGRRQAFPEIDRAAWFSIAEARAKILKGQAGSIDLLDALAQAQGR